MPVKTPAPGDLEPIERASRDELQALQLQRLQWTLQHAYDHVPHYRRPSTRTGVHPSDCKSLADLAKFPFTRQGRPARQLPVRHVRGAARAGGARARHLGHHRQADGGGLHAGRHRPLGRPGGALDPRHRRPRRRHRARGLRLRPVHRRPGRALRRRAAGLHGGADERRPDREAGAADQRLQARHHHGHAELHAGDRRGVPAPGAGPARRCR